MNWLDKKKAAGLLWLAPLLFACESDEILSLPQEPGDQTLNLYFTEIPLPFSLVQVDSIFTSRRSDATDYHLLVGNYRNEPFGQIQASAFTEFTPGSRPEITTEDRYDSLVLVVANDYFYGDATGVGSQTVGIYPLADTLTRKAYYSTDQAAFLPTALAEFTFTPDPEVTSSADTIRISLDDTFGQELFDQAQANASTLSTDSAFREYFPGIALTSRTENEFITGFDPARMSMVLYFSTSEETTSSTYTFGISDDRDMTFNSISVDRSGTPLAAFTTLNQEMMADDGRFYLQSGTGLMPVLRLQPILDFIEAVEDSAEASLRINRVDLYIGTTSSGDGQPLPEAIFAYGFDEDFDIITDTVPDNFGRLTISPRGLRIDNTSSNSTVSPILPEASKYRAQITRYTQLLLDKVSGAETEFIIRPSSPGNTLNQIVAEPDSIIAKVYYTLLE